MTDTATFLLAFAAVFGGIAWLLVRLERHASALQRRVDRLERQP